MANATKRNGRPIAAAVQSFGRCHRQSVQRLEARQWPIERPGRRAPRLRSFCQMLGNRIRKRTPVQRGEILRTNGRKDRLARVVSRSARARARRRCRRGAAKQRVVFRPYRFQYGRAMLGYVFGRARLAAKLGDPGAEIRVNRAERLGNDKWCVHGSSPLSVPAISGRWCAYGRPAVSSVIPDANARHKPFVAIVQA